MEKGTCLCEAIGGCGRAQSGSGHQSAQVLTFKRVVHVKAQVPRTSSLIIPLFCCVLLTLGSLCRLGVDSSIGGVRTIRTWE